jgi:hypothetical protein
MNEDLNYIAFVSLAEVEDGVMRGGILVTDSNGKPVEFRCTSSIHPNSVQRTLYGSTLMPHIAVETSWRAASSGVQASPDVVLVQQEEFLALRRRNQETPAFGSQTRQRHPSRSREQQEAGGRIAVKRLRQVCTRGRNLVTGTILMISGNAKTDSVGCFPTATWWSHLNA